VSSSDFVETLRRWINTEGFPAYDLEADSARGHCGMVFFLKAKQFGFSPAQIAVKTLDLKDLKHFDRTLEELHREFGMWLRLTEHNNILLPLGLQVATVELTASEDCQGGRAMQIPLMPMKRMDGSLRDWIGSERFSAEAKLSALAQAFNGLAHIYRNGLEGHGDLKPENILYIDQSRGFAFPDDAWISKLPWVIKIADFGWADAWRDYGYKNKALRQYMAPERLGENASVVPEKSDMFAMGIIAAEVLQGDHPAGCLKKVRKSDGEWVWNVKSDGVWRKTVERGEWNLEGICSPRLLELVKRCLNPIPMDRPSAVESVEIVCKELKEVYGVDIRPTLDLWSKESVRDVLPWVSPEREEIGRLRSTIGLGKEEAKKAVLRLREILCLMEPANLYSIEDWIRGAEALLDVLERDRSQEADADRKRVRAKARDLFSRRLGMMSKRDFETLSQSINVNDYQRPFQHFAHIIGDLSELANIDFEQAYQGEWGLSDLALSGFAFAMHSRSRLGYTKRGTMDYLNIAIDLSPGEAVLYYYRASHQHDLLVLWRIKEGTSGDGGVDIQRIVSDLEKAIQLEPEWNKPRETLEAVRGMI
jgi:serine/threonine protein kinase